MSDAHERRRLLHHHRHGHLSALRQAAIFQEYGRTGAADGSDPAAQITKRAQAIKEADPKLTFAKAYELALKADPKAYDEYLVTKRDQQRGA